MATQAQAITRVRKRVADFKSQKYDNSYYEEALRFSLSKLSHDFGVEYLTVESVPMVHEFLLEKLAAIEMCYIRAVEEQDKLSDDSDNLKVSSVTVPDLQIAGPATSESEETNIWLDLAEQLQQEYDGELENSGGASNTAEVQQIVVNRKSTKTGGLASRKLDPGLPAVSISAVVEGMSVSLSWSKLYSDLFSHYSVRRATVSDMSDEKTVAVFSDNDHTEYVDEVTSIGVYYYRVMTVNPNLLETSSNTLAVEVT
jgi:hypothetical protein